MTDKKEYNKQYYLDNIDRIKSQQKTNRDINKEEHNKFRREKYKKSIKQDLWSIIKRIEKKENNIRENIIRRM